MSQRLKGMGSARYENGFRVTLHHDLLETPTQWRTPQLVFVNSMSDLFHPAVPLSFIRRVFETMENASHHTFQVLTKRAQRLVELAPTLPWPRNVWMGVTVESQPYMDRVEQLRGVPAAVRFVSFEPLLGLVAAPDLAGIHWVIVGGESGPGARALDPEWVTAIRDRCVECRVPFFFKQWGGQRKRTAGRLLDGRLWNEFPRAGMAASRA
jgi:protein gp37